MQAIMRNSEMLIKNHKENFSDLKKNDFQVLFEKRASQISSKKLILNDSKSLPFNFDDQTNKIASKQKTIPCCENIASLVAAFSKKIEEYTENVDEEYMTMIKMHVIPETENKLNEFFEENCKYLATSNDKFTIKKNYLRDNVFNKY